MKFIMSTQKQRGEIEKKSSEKNERFERIFCEESSKINETILMNENE